MQCTSEQGIEQMVNIDPLNCDDKTIPAPSQKGFKDTAMIELDAMGRANSTLEDFVSTEFPCGS